MGWSNVASAVLEANTVIVIAGQPNTGIFLYNGTPATGNLIGSWAAAAGTDPYGNAYPRGLASFTNSSLPDIGLDLGRLLIGTGATSWPNAASISGLNTPGQIRVATGTTNTNTAPVLADFFPGTSGAPTGSATAPYTSFNSTALSGAKTDIYVSGSIINGSGPAGAATWQTPTYNTGWAGGDAGGVFRPFQFRLDAENNLMCAGTFRTTSATPSTFAFVLPSGYHPTTNQRVGTNALNVGTNTVIPGYFQVGLNGSTGFFTPAVGGGASGVEVYVSHLFPLGALS